MSIPDHYQPGVCNIGPAEIRRRKQAGWIGLAATLALGAALLLSHTPPLWRLLIFFPAFMAATGYWQARLHFCLRFGLKAVYNFGEPGKEDSVPQAQFRALDRKKALRIALYSAMTAGVVTVYVLFLR